MNSLQDTLRSAALSTIFPCIRFTHSAELPVLPQHHDLPVAYAQPFEPSRRSPQGTAVIPLIVALLSNSQQL